MASDPTLTPPTTPTAPAPTTPFNSPHVPVVQDTPEVDRDSGYGIDDDDAASTISVNSTVHQFEQENGRTYHKYCAGRYLFPNDEKEKNRLDMQHCLISMTLDRASIGAPGGQTPTVLHLAPITTNGRVLDVGTGTGIWAIDFADENPNASVTGVDLSPIQPSWVPPNVEFVLDNIEDTWDYCKKFNFIHARMMVGSLENWPRFLRRCFENVMPGGYVEVMAPDWPFRSDDDSLHAESALNKWSFLIQRASIHLKRPIDVAPLINQLMLRAGFVNIFEHVYKWPINTWPKDEKFKEIGRYVNQNLSEGLEGFSLKFLTGGLGWDKQEVEVLCAKVRNELRDRRIHAYLNIHVVYGHKPNH